MTQIVDSPTSRFLGCSGILFMEVQMALKIGDEAPDFRLSSTTGSTQGEFQLSAYRGKNVVVCFYALDFTPV